MSKKFYLISLLFYQAVEKAKKIKEKTYGNRIGSGR